MEFNYDDINIVPRQKTIRKCNDSYIPHKTPKYSNKEEWVNTYNNELQDMYSLIKNNIETNFPNQIDWSRPSISNNLITVIYHCSSKYIDTTE